MKYRYGEDGRVYDGKIIEKFRRYPSLLFGGGGIKMSRVRNGRADTCKFYFVDILSYYTGYIEEANQFCIKIYGWKNIVSGEILVCVSCSSLGVVEIDFTRV